MSPGVSINRCCCADISVSVGKRDERKEDRGGVEKIVREGGSPKGGDEDSKRQKRADKKMRRRMSQQQ